MYGKGYFSLSMCLIYELLQSCILYFAAIPMQYGWGSLPTFLGNTAGYNSLKTTTYLSIFTLVQLEILKIQKERLEGLGLFLVSI